MDVKCRLLHIYILFTWLRLSRGQICMSSNIQNDRLRLVCKVKNFELEVYIRNSLGDQQIRCLIPYPKPSCFAYNGDVTQNLSSNITVWTLAEDLRRDHQVNGKWSCLHGTNNERATVNVNILGPKEADEVSINVHISGPKTVKTHQAFMLSCSSTEVPEIQDAKFYVKNEVSNQVTEIERKCETHLNHSMCSDIKSNELVYHAPKSSGISTFSCAMTIPLFGELSDCMFVQVIDLTGPNLSQDSNSPIFANTVLTIVCTALSAENQVYLSWTCVNGTREDDILVTSSTTTFISKLTYEVKITDNGRICTCNAHIGSFSSTDTITLDVRTEHTAFHIRLLLWILITTAVFIITVSLSTLFMKMRTLRTDGLKSGATGAIYFAAPEDKNRVNFYDDISHYDEIEN